MKRHAMSRKSVHHTAAYSVLISMLIFALIFIPNFHAEAVTLPPGFTQNTFASGLSNPTAMEFAPDGRLFVLQQAGAVRIVKNGALLATPFHTLTVDSAGERGLLGIAFDPGFNTNHFLYLYYTVPGSPAHNRVSRFTANGDVVVSSSEVPLIDLDNLSSATNHNGGAMHFGPDGKLYVAVGENANSANSQTLNNRLGKILRVNADASIPTDNPFYGTATGLNRSIWAMGLRNPFTFAFQPGTGRMHINDVGQSTWEEINRGQAGANYGWPTTEGPTSNPSFVGPIYAYQHSAGSPTGCAITGGAFYNPATVTFPADYSGDYFFADYCGDWIYRYDIATNSATSFATATGGSPVDLKVGTDGALYYLSRGAGAVLRVQYTAGIPTNTNTPIPTSTPTLSNPPTGNITSPASGTTYNAGQTISYSGTGSDPEDGTLPASAFEWQVVFHHDTHTHPFLGPVAGVTSGTFTIPTQGETSANVWYRIYLRVHDSDGQVNESFVDVHPNVSSITVNSNPAGLKVKVNGQPFTAPYTFNAVVGMQQNIGADSPQTSGSTTYEFSAWSDSGGRIHDITIPSSATTYTADFVVRTATIWVDDALPVGAVANGDTDGGWNWVSSPLPDSGAIAHQSPLKIGVHQHFFANATNKLQVNTGDTLIASAYLDPANPPTEIMLQWYDGTWEHRAYWGANSIAWGTNGTVSRRYMGTLRATGGWVRLEVPAVWVGLEGHILNGMAFTAYNGRVTWDRAGKDGTLPIPTNTLTYTPSATVTRTPSPTATLTLTPSQTPTPLPAVLWVDDALPAGAVPNGDADGWNWVNNPTPDAGTLAHKSPLKAGIHQHFFTGATNKLQILTGDTLIASVYLDPANPPTEIMLQWYDGTWEHRAYWGTNSIAWGTNGTNSRRYMGALPATGGWMRLEVPAALVGLEGKLLNGMAFTLYNGQATWDRAGKGTLNLPTVTPTRSFTPTPTSTRTPGPLVLWVDDALPAGAVANGDTDGWNWINTNFDSGTLAHQSALRAGTHQHFFGSATNKLQVNPGDILIASVYLNPTNPPTEIMLQWYDGTWEHRAYWGANSIAWGTNGTVSRRYMGTLPATGGWVRLEVSAALVGLEGHLLNGMAFTLYNGQAIWDRAGKQ